MNENLLSRPPVIRGATGSVRLRLLRFSLLAMTAWFLSPLSAQTTIAILNSSFEDPTLTVSPYYTTNGATDWTRTISTIPAGTFAPVLSATTPAAIDGSQVGYANGSGGLQQVLSATFAANQLYTYSVYIGCRFDEVSGAQATGAITLGYLLSDTFTPLSSQSTLVSRGNFNFVTGSYTTTELALGQPIVLQLTNLESFQVIFDQVQLSVTAVPEPAAFACTLGAAALGIAWWRRRGRPRGSSAQAGA
ncbi:MAG: hypothetical protein Q7S40_06360 [Opitutaceae bacterium]|nr:hypothetical protein [Opitutaceae bacterium]